MKDTRSEILLSLESLNKDQQVKVLSFIRNFTSPQKAGSDDDFKIRALREIQLALKSKIFLV
ncbi:MAG TPA: hypothetical protein VGA21_05570 [Cyclobacteriaceae bacterium]|jgi:hypothetical protein